MLITFNFIVTNIAAFEVKWQKKGVDANNLGINFIEINYMSHIDKMYGNP